MGLSRSLPITFSGSSTTATERPIIEEHSYTQPLALDDGVKRGPLRFDGDNVLDPGGACLITRADSYRLKPVSSEVSPSAAGRAQVAQRELAALAEHQKTIFAS
jgi:hypothetical protein